MDNRELDPLLRQTLADHRLTGGEKQALGALLADLGSDPQRLAFCRHRAFALAREELADPQAVQVLGWLEEVLKLCQPHQPEVAQEEAHFSPGDACLQAIVRLLGQARRQIDVCVFTITDDRITHALLAAHRRGVPLRILTDNEKLLDAGSDINELSAAGIPVRVDHTPYHMHHKFAVFDNTWLLTGSYNWTRGAAANNEENLIVTTSRRLVPAFSEAFERLWRTLA